MIISCVETGWSATLTKVVKEGQIEAVAYFVIENTPYSCDGLPANGSITFQNITMEVGGKQVVPQWLAKQERPACNSTAVILSPESIQFTWGTSPSA